MAKKGVEVAAVADINQRRAMLDLVEKDLKAAGALVVGDTIKVTLVGKVKAVSQRESYNKDSKVYGSLDVDITSLDIAEAGNGKIVELLDEDE